jgi:hypothetical protein
MQPSIGLVAASNWNSLEVVKLAVAAATPVVIFALGYQVNRAARRIDAVQWVSRKLVEERLPLYREIAPSLNDLLCFFMLVGHFRAIDPPKAIAIKRDVDRTVHANLYLFTPKFMERYYAFMQTCFATFVGVEQRRSFARPSPSSVPSGGSGAMSGTRCSPQKKTRLPPKACTPRT